MRSTTLSLLILALAGSIAGGSVADIPAHPSELQFRPLEFTPPLASEYRHELPGGIPVYVAPDHEFPLVTISFFFKGGAYLDPPDQVGLSDALGSMMRRGGTTSVSAEDLDERLDFLAANVNVFVGAEQSGASINCLKSNFDEAFGLLMDMVLHPGFDEGRLRVYKDEVIERMKQRNDSPRTVAMMNLGKMMFGSDHHAGRQPTKSMIESITPERLRALHGKIFHPGNLIVAVTGDVEADSILSTLAQAFDGWQIGERAPDPPAPTVTPTPGLFHADTTQKDLPQGTAFIMTRTIRRDDPDEIPMTVMNDILGGGGFTSRIMSRVRSDEGLAYSAGSFLRPEVYYPGSFMSFFQSKNRTVALATKIIFEEINRIASEPVSAEDLQLTQNSFIERFPQRFASKASMLGVFVIDEMTGRDPHYWQHYRENIRSVTAEDVQRVAQQYLVPGRMLILIVGNWDEIYGGDLEGRASMNEFFEGNVTHLPMLDPLTLEPVKK